MRPADPTVIKEHNLRQRSYFERSVKRNMIPTDSPYLRRHVEELLRFGGISPGERALEVGCGMGRYTLLLAQWGVQVEGPDLSPVLLERLRAYNAGRFDIPLHCVDLHDPPSALHGRYDSVLGFFTLHHIKDLEQCFQGVARLLKPRGRAIFLEPNPFNPLYYLQILITPGMTWEGDGGIVRMRREPVVQAMERAGFTRCAMTRFGFFPPFLANRPVWAAWEKWVERIPFLYPLLPFQLFYGESSG